METEYASGSAEGHGRLGGGGYGAGADVVDAWHDGDGAGDDSGAGTAHGAGFGHGLGDGMGDVEGLSRGEAYD